LRNAFSGFARLPRLEAVGNSRFSRLGQPFSGSARLPRSKKCRPKAIPLSAHLLGKKQMETIDIFYQGHGMREIEHIEAGRDHTVAVIKEVLFKKHGWEADTLVFLEDREDPLEDHVVIFELVQSASANLHLHRCRHVDVTVRFNGRPAERKFAPSATIARIKHWAAVKQFGMTEEQAAEHLLQIAGTKDRPAPGVHAGTLTSCPGCKVTFDLVPDERVNG
jgi:hypothetical protein